MMQKPQRCAHSRPLSPEALHQIALIEVQLAALKPHAVVKPSNNFSTYDFYLKHKIAKEWQNLNKWIEVRRLQDLPLKFEKGTIVTLKRIGKCKVKEVSGIWVRISEFSRVSGQRDERTWHPQRPR
jgi:hypothetical protein